MAARIEDRLARRGGAVELLRLPAAVFGAVSGLRATLYDRGWMPRERVEAPVVSVGNLTAGGTGKTPMVAWLVREFQRRGLRPGIVSRGYGKQGDGPNDEALELAAALGDVPHVQDPDRASAARELLPGADVIVLDDGFQHRRLARDLDLVLVDATRPWGLAAAGGEPVRALLPRGLLRERPGALRRADAVVLTRADQVDPDILERLEVELTELAPGVPILRAEHVPARLVRLDGGEASAAGPLEELRGAVVVPLSGIGHPAAFEDTLRALGAELREARRFPDHHAYTPAELSAALELAASHGALLVVTAKDAGKLRGVAAGLDLERVRVLEIELALTSGAPVLAALLDALPESKAQRERRTLHEGLHG